jgi:hypothetical protein
MNKDKMSSFKSSTFNDDDITQEPTSSSIVPSTIKQEPGYKSCLLSRLKKQRDEESSMCDMCICVGDQKFYVHRCLMTAACDYFDVMLRGDWQESYQDTIEMKDINANALSAVIDFIYSGELKLSLRNIEEILRVVSHLQVNQQLSRYFYFNM